MVIFKIRVYEFILNKFILFVDNDNDLLIYANDNG